jgi:hypothetical protein
MARGIDRDKIEAGGLEVDASSALLLQGFDALLNYRAAAPRGLLRSGQPLVVLHGQNDRQILASAVDDRRLLRCLSQNLRQFALGFGDSDTAWWSGRCLGTSHARLMVTNSLLHPASSFSVLTAWSSSASVL